MARVAQPTNFLPPDTLSAADRKAVQTRGLDDAGQVQYGPDDTLPDWALDIVIDAGQTYLLATPDTEV